MSSCAERMRSVKYSSSRKPWAGLPRVLILLLTPSFLHLRFCSHNLQGIPSHYTRAHGVFLSASPDNRDCLFAFVCGVPILRACVRCTCSYGLPHSSYAKGRWSAYRFFPWAIYKRHDRILYRLSSAHFYEEPKCAAIFENCAPENGNSAHIILCLQYFAG